MLKRSTLQLLRFHFSIFLLPIYLFALSQSLNLDVGNTILIFIILHILVYPASNGYNSYMDRDEGSIGGIEKPLTATMQLFIVSVIMDIIAIALSFLIHFYFAVGIIIYILASRAYSYRKIRLKKYPFLGYLTVISCQGALVYWLVKFGASEEQSTQVSYVAILAATLLIGGFYPLTQIYQHEQDKADGVRTLSQVLGYRGTFIFTLVIYFAAMGTLGYYFASNLELDRFFIIQAFLLPVMFYFFWWMRKVYKNTSAANYKNTMRMNVIAALSSNAAFLSILILEKL